MSQKESWLQIYNSFVKNIVKIMKTPYKVGVNIIILRKTLSES